ncbi:MAG: hypothetical protein ABSA68_09565 [Xanthobacteraceae bacterium]
MKHACITQSSSIMDGDVLGRRLQNVFRILAKPEHELREKALNLREEVSSTYRIQATQGEWFAWPSTIASRGVRELKEIGWRPHGMLSFLGYHVGEMQATPSDIRLCILEYAFECHLPPLNDLAYYLEWGGPQTAQRLNKLANTLAALTRNAKRRNAASYATAIDDWECDLAFLRDRYYCNFLHFGWPATNHLH